MKPFLSVVAETFYQEYGDDVNNIAFVFPNRRAGIFFQKYLATVAGKPLFSPPIFTINDFLVEQSGFQTADRIGMLFMLYSHFIELSGSDESFDDFLFWGEMLLNDFDDVDKYMVNARQLFTNIQELKEIDEQFELTLEDGQIEAIQRFWSNFIPAQGSAKKETFIALWEILFPLYTKLRETLRIKGLAYEGMIFREVAEKARRKEWDDLPWKQVVFVGLNALTTAERYVLSSLKEIGVADFYWDYESPMIQDVRNRASFFMRKNVVRYPSRLTLNLDLVVSAPEIELIGIPSAVGQAKQVQSILTELVASGEIPDPGKAINTAVVLPEEHLLLPVLHSIPQEIDPINVTMGYTLSSTPVAGLMKTLFDLQKQIRYSGGNARFFHKKVLTLLSHRYIFNLQPELATNLSEYIKRYNRVFLSEKELAKNELLSLIFTPVTNALQAADYLLNILDCLQKQISPSVGNEEDEELKEGLSALEKEFLFHYYITIKRLKEVMSEHAVVMNEGTFFRLLEKMAASISIPFRGEPLSGLQVMGVLETRALDFENLIIFSMNEGVFPLRKVANTFIPYNLRKGFGLSTTEHQDSIYAYYFYRMIYRAKRVFLLYDTRSEGMQTGEVSRYLYQLKYHYRVPVREKLITYNIAVNRVQAITVGKSGAVAERMSRFLKGGNKSLSASAINTYLNCPLQFYFRNVEGVNEEDEVAESIESGTFGDIYHEVMEHLYAPLQGKLVTGDLLEKQQRDDVRLTALIRESYARHYFKTDQVKELTGQNFLVGEVIRKYVKQTLLIDRKRTPFIYLESEKEMLMELPLGEGRVVRLKGFIDRVDEKDGTVRIVDYKTGSVKRMEFEQVSDLFDISRKDRAKETMQVFLYALMYNEEKHPLRIEPAIYVIRSLFSKDFDGAVYCKTDSRQKTKVDNFSDYETEYREALVACIREIFDSEIPFFQTENPKNCEYCAFRSICKR